MSETDHKRDKTQDVEMEYSAARKNGDKKQSEKKKHSESWSRKNKMTRTARSPKRENDTRKTELQSDG